jgi:hypothetical protein
MLVAVVAHAPKPTITIVIAAARITMFASLSKAVVVHNVDEN